MRTVHRWEERNGDGIEHVFATPGGHKFKVSVHRDRSYMKQCHSQLRMWCDGAGWDVVATGGNAMTYERDAEDMEAYFIDIAHRFVGEELGGY